MSFEGDIFVMEKPGHLYNYSHFQLYLHRVAAGATAKSDNEAS